MDLTRQIADAVLSPFVALPPLAGLIVLSLLLGLLFLLAFKYVSPRQRLQRVKDRMSATVYEMRLFGDHPWLVLKAQGRALALVVVYLLLALPALALLAPPMGVLLARAALHHELRPLASGEQSLLSVSLDPGVRDPVTVVSRGPGVEVRPPVVQPRGGGAAHVRIRAAAAGTHDLVVRCGDEQQVKRVVVGEAGPVSPLRAGAGTLALLLSDEPPLPGGSRITGVRIDYPGAAPALWGLPWWAVLLVISLAVAFALRRRLGVVF